jgi:hypothetical protein
VPGCFKSSDATVISTPPPLADLSKLKLHGAVTSGGLDTVTLTTASGDIAANAQDSVLNLASTWSGAEFNVFGDCCSSEAYFNSGSNLKVVLSVTNGTANAPNCISTFKGFTAETNNLDLVANSCSQIAGAAGAAPAIVFSERGGGPLPRGVTIGDTHLTTFFKVHYDFQASGDFVLVQADPGLLVQTRQKPVSTSPVVSVNTAVGTKMQNNRVAVCLTGLSVNGSLMTLADGESLSLANGVTVSRKGSVYTVSSQSGDVVQADLSPGSYMNVSVMLE